MLKKVPSRSQRAKGIRVKHILQIVLLLGVCFWLLYQLKHFYDKKAALAENESKTSIRTQTESELLKLGRKDLPQKDVRAHVKQEEDEEEEALREEEEKHEVENEKHEAEEQEQEKEDPVHEVEDIEEEGQKHEAEDIEEEGEKREAEEQEEEDNKNEDPEDEQNGAGDEEMDENDLETKEGGDDHNENLVDEEKEREDGVDEKDGERNEDEEREDREDNENSSDDQDNEGGDTNAHEAREEQYKGDDASSAVTHDTQVISTETEKLSLESSNETSETSEDEDGNRHNMRLMDGRTSENGTSSLPASEEKLEGNSSNPEANSVVDADVKIQSIDPENKSTIVSSEVSNNLAEVNQTASSHQPNGTETISESVQSQNAAVDGMATKEGSTEQTVAAEQTNDTISVKDQSDSNATVSSNEVETNVSEKILISDGTAGVENSSTSSTIKETTDATGYGELVNKKNEESVNEDASMNEESNDQAPPKTEESNDTSESSSEDEGSDSTNKTEDVVQDDPIDSSDSHISEDEKEVRTDLDTLPEIQTEGDENGEAAAE